MISPLSKSVTEVMFWFVMYMSESIESTHRERVLFQGSNFVALFTFKNNISPAAPDLELILFPLWYWLIMNACTKQQEDEVFETDFIDSQKSDPPFAHLLALSHVCVQVHAVLCVCVCVCVCVCLFVFFTMLCMSMFINFQFLQGEHLLRRSRSRRL